MCNRIFFLAAENKKNIDVVLPVEKRDEVAGGNYTTKGGA